MNPKYDLRMVLNSIQYKNWYIRVSGTDSDNPEVQWAFLGRDADTGTLEWQYGRKYRLSKHMTEGEVVQTMFAAALAAEEHEARESFLYRSKRVFNPHLSIDALLSRADMTEKRA